MAKRTSPTVRRRRLAKELRQLRRESGKTREQVSSFVGCSPVTITRIEGAQTAGTVAIVARMLEAYGVTGERFELLLTLCREARKRGWWQPYSSEIPEWFQVYVGIEEEAASIRDYQPEVIPGLLQTEGYARATYLAEPIVPSDDEIERQVILRLGRQRRLLESDDVPAMWFVLNEGVLHRVAGGSLAFREQLEKLIMLSHMPNVTIQVLPFSSGAHPGMQGGFTILSFPELTDPDVAYLEYRQGSLYLEVQSEIDNYTLTFDHLRAQALGRNESRALIAQAAKRLT